MLFLRHTKTHASGVILALILAIFANFVLQPAFTSSIYAKYADSVLLFLPEMGKGHTIIKEEGDVNQEEFVIIKFVTYNKITLPSSSVQSANNKLKGTLIVTTKVINNSADTTKKPSDFRINIHGNDPSPSSFLGNSSGTPISMNMGMYSVTVSGPPGYKATFLGDCSGGIMTVETKKCTIINSVQSKPVISNK